MATYVSASSVQGGSAQTTLSWNHDTGSQTNSYLIVALMWGDAAAAVNSVTANAVAMDFLGQSPNPFDTPTAGQSVAIYGIAGVSGVVDIDVDVASAEMWAASILLSDVDQTTPVRDFDIASGPSSGDTNSSNPISVTVDSDTGDLVIAVATRNQTNGLTPSAGTSVIAHATSDNAYIQRYAGASPSVTSAWTTTDAAFARTHLIALSFQSPSGGTGATVTPTQGAVTTVGRAPLVNDFASIVLRGSLINEAGSPLADLTGLSCLVWYNTAPAGAPDESLSSLTTNSNGSYSFALALGGLAFGEQVYRVIYRNDPPTANNCRVHSPSYES